MATKPNSGPPKPPPDPRDVFNQRTAEMRANADSIIAQTIKNIRGNAELSRAFDQIGQLGFSQADLVALTHFESSGGVLNSTKSSSALGAAQFTEERFYDDFRRFASPQNIERIRAVAPEIAQDFQQAVGHVTLETDAVTKQKYISADPIADQHLLKYRDNPLAQFFFISENVRIHQGKDAGDLANLRLAQNYGVAGMNKINDAFKKNPNMTMGEIFDPHKSNVLSNNKIPPNLTVRDFMAREKDIYSLFVASAQKQLPPVQPIAVAGNAIPPPPPISAAPPEAVVSAPGEKDYVVLRRGDVEVIHFVDPAAAGQQTAAPSAAAPPAEATLPPSAPTIPSRHGAARPPPPTHHASAHPQEKEPHKSKAPKPAHAEPHRPQQSITGIIANNFRQ